MFVRFLRPSVRVTREHAQTHEHLWVLSEGAWRDWGTARRGARPALVSQFICGSVNPRASAFTRRWAITLPITFYAAPEETARRCRPMHPSSPGTGSLQPWVRRQILEVGSPCGLPCGTEG